MASGVKFIVHDAIHEVLNRDTEVIKNGQHIDENFGCIEVMDNVFIGSGTTIMPGIRIGPNAVIDVGSLVNKDIHENSVCVGGPAKQIGKYTELINKRSHISNDDNNEGLEEIEKDTVEKEWQMFFDKRKKES